MDEPKLATLRDGVRESLPEINLISDEELRDQVVEVHARALAETGFRRIEDIPPSGVPGSPLMRAEPRPTTTAVSPRWRSAWPTGWRPVMGDIGIDRDLLIAGALVHDVGKAWEYEQWERWKGDRTSETG